MSILLKYGLGDPTISSVITVEKACLEIDATIAKLRAALEKIEKSPQAAWEIVFIAKEALAT